MRTPKTDDELIRMFREAEFWVDISQGGTGPCVLADGTAIDGEERVERAIRRDLGLPVDGRSRQPGGWTGATIAMLRSPLDPQHRARLERICAEGRRLGPLPEQLELLKPKPTKTMYFVRALGPYSPPDGGVGLGWFEDSARALERADEFAAVRSGFRCVIEECQKPTTWPAVVDLLGHRWREGESATL